MRVKWYTNEHTIFFAVCSECRLTVVAIIATGSATRIVTVPSVIWCWTAVRITIAGAVAVRRLLIMRHVASREKAMG